MGNKKDIFKVKVFKTRSYGYALLDKDIYDRTSGTGQVRIRDYLTKKEADDMARKLNSGKYRLGWFGRLEKVV